MTIEHKTEYIEGNVFSIKQENRVVKLLRKFLFKQIIVNATLKHNKIKHRLVFVFMLRKDYFRAY